MLWEWSDWAEAEMGGAWFWCRGVGVVCRVGAASWWCEGVVGLGRGLIGRGLEWAWSGGGVTTVWKRIRLGDAREWAGHNCGRGATVGGARGVGAWEGGGEGVV